MIRIGVLGANGQVGAELCLLLSQQKGVEVVPISRNRMGSAFLRFHGLPCRHGQPADPLQAPRLFGDCDVIANLALANLASNYGEAKDVHDNLIRNVARYAKRPGKHIYFSTMSVYGDARAYQRIVFRDVYGSEKRRCEKIARDLGEQHGVGTYIFRLGHVCGELQSITLEIRRRIAVQPILVPDLDRASNTVQVASIVDAILMVAAERVRAGTYDLMNVPQWSWKEVFEREGREIGVTPRFHVCSEKTGAHSVSSLTSIAKSFIMEAARNPLVRRVGSRLLALLPARWSHLLKSSYSTKAAAGEIAKLLSTQKPMDAVLRRPVGRRFVDGLTPTIELLCRSEFRLPDHDPARSWPDDLPLVEGGLIKEVLATTQE